MTPNIITVTTVNEDGAEATYSIAPFTMAKSWYVGELLDRLVQASGLGETISSLGELQTKVLLGESGSILGQLLGIIPKFLRQGNVPVYQLLGLIVTKSKQIETLERDEESVLDYCYSLGNDIAHSCTPDQAIDIFKAGLTQLSEEPIVENAANFIKRLVVSFIQERIPAQKSETINSVPSSQNSSDGPLTTVDTD